MLYKKNGYVAYISYMIKLSIAGNLIADGNESLSKLTTGNGRSIDKEGTNDG